MYNPMKYLNCCLHFPKELADSSLPFTSQDIPIRPVSNAPNDNLPSIPAVQLGNQHISPQAHGLPRSIISSATASTPTHQSCTSTNAKKRIRITVSDIAIRVRTAIFWIPAGPAVYHGAHKQKPAGIPHYRRRQNHCRFEGEVQWQRLGIARAIYRNAHILNADEPSVSLDARAEARIFQSLQMARIAANVTDDHLRITVLITHQIANITSADEIVVLDHGRIIETGTHTELILKQGNYYALYSTYTNAYQHPPRSQRKSRQGCDELARNAAGYRGVGNLAYGHNS